MPINALLNKNPNIITVSKENNSEYKQYPNKKSYDMTIPANIFQTWHNKKLPPRMYYAMKQI